MQNLQIWYKVCWQSQSMTQNLKNYPSMHQTPYRLNEIRLRSLREVWARTLGWEWPHYPWKRMLKCWKELNRLKKQLAMSRAHSLRLISIRIRRGYSIDKATEMKIRSHKLINRHAQSATKITTDDAIMNGNHATIVGNTSTSRALAWMNHRKEKGRHIRGPELRAELMLSTIVRRRLKNM